MAHAPMMLAHGNKEAVELRGCGLGKGAHITDELAGFRAGLLAESLVCDGHEFFGVDVVYHADRRVLRSLIPIIVVLAVVALGFDVRVSMNVAA